MCQGTLPGRCSWFLRNWCSHPHSRTASSRSCSSPCTHRSDAVSHLQRDQDMSWAQHMCSEYHPGTIDPSASDPLPQWPLEIQSACMPVSDLASASEAVLPCTCNCENPLPVELHRRSPL